MEYILQPWPCMFLAFLIRSNNVITGPILEKHFGMSSNLQTTLSIGGAKNIQTISRSTGSPTAGTLTVVS